MKCSEVLLLWTGRPFDVHSIPTRFNKAAIRMFSAWASDQKLVLGQRKVDDKSNEITAIPELLKLLELEGVIATIDAMGCQRKICQQGV